MTVYTILTTHVFKASEWDRTTDKGFFLRKGQKIGKKGNTRYHTRRQIEKNKYMYNMKRGKIELKQKLLSLS